MWVDFTDSRLETGSPDNVFTSITEAAPSVFSEGLMMIRAVTTSEMLVLTGKMMI